MSKERDFRDEIYSQPNTHKFLKAVVADGVIGRVTKNGEVSPRDLNVTGTYLASPATLEEISDIYPSFNTKQRTGQIVRSTVRRFWENCSQETQERFPWDEIDLTKPRTLKARQRIAVARGVESCEIRKLIEEECGTEEILKKTGITKRGLITARYRLREEGIRIPYINAPPKRFEEFAGKLEEATDTNTVQQLLDKVTPGFYQRDFRQENRLLVSIREVARRFHYINSDTPLFVVVLKEKGIPAGIAERTVKSGLRKGLVQRCYFIHRQHLYLAREILDQNPLFDQYKTGFNLQRRPFVFPGKKLS